MVVVVVFLLVAACAGICKPYIGTLSRKHFAWIAAGLFVVFMILSARLAEKAPAPPPATAGKDTPAQPAATAAAPAEPATKWTYQDSKDEMRGTTSHSASVESENMVDLDFPYGEQRGSITVRHSPGEGLNVMFAVGKGQILCSNFTHSILTVKFDQGAVQTMDCTGTSDGSSETAFFTNPARMLAGLKKAKHTVIEAEFFNRGRQQFAFETAGLAWK